MSDIVVGRCPLRISFLGGGTDIMSVIEKLPGKTGMALATPINKFVYAQALVGKTKYEDVQIDPRVDTPLTHAVLKKFLDWGDTLPVASITMMSDIPVLGTGLGGSAAWVHALGDMFKKARKADYQMMTATNSYELEHSSGSFCGYQDHVIAEARRPSLMQFKISTWDKTRVESSVVHCPTMARALEHTCNLFYIGGKRDGNEILKRVGEIEYNVSDMIHLLEKGFTAMTLGDIPAFGECVRHSWKIKRSLDTAISNPRIDEIIRASVTAGSFGSKLLGAGGAGYVLTVGRQLEVKEALLKEFQDIKHVPFRFYDAMTEEKAAVKK